MLAFIRGTITTKGLKVEAELDKSIYEKGIKVSDKERATLNIKRTKRCSDLNYAIISIKSGNN
jgi:hypothetical protein